MVGLDTNILVRQLIQDDPEQSQLVRHLVEDVCTVENPGHVELVVLCEVVWVLSAAYGFGRADIAAALRQILLTETFDVQEHALAWLALREYQSSGADFADCVIAIANRDRGCKTTYTFDKQASRSTGFTLLTEKSL
jgi:predicted nucleic-acid-binding protein